MPDLQPDFEITIAGRQLSAEQKLMVRNLSYEESIESGRACTLRFTIAEMRGRRFDDLGLAVEAPVVLSLGYVGRTWEYFSGVIVDFNAELSDGDAPSLSVECHDLSYRLKSHPIPPMTIHASSYREAFEIIAGGYGLTAYTIDPPDALNVPLPADRSLIVGGIADDYERVDSYQAPKDVGLGDTAWVALDRIARRFGLKLLVRESALLIVTTDFVAKGQKKKFTLVYDWYPDAELGKGERPIRSLRIKHSLKGKNNSVKADFWTPDANDEGSDASVTTSVPGDHAVIGQAPEFTPIGSVPSYWGLNGSSHAAENQRRWSELPSRILIGVLGLRAFFDRFAEEVDFSRSLPKGGVSLDVIDVKPPDEEAILSAFERFRLSDPLKIERFIDRSREISAREALRTEDEAHLTPDEAAQVPAVPMPLKSNEPTIYPIGPDARSQKEAIARARAEQRAVYEKLTTATGECDWMPEIRAAHKHNIRINALGLQGRLDSGEYVLETVRHTLGDGGARTEFTLTRPYFQTIFGNGTIAL